MSLCRLPVPLRRPAACLLAGFLGLAGSACWAAGEDVQLEITGTTLPRFDGGERSTRLDMLLMPARRSGLGLAFGITNATPQPSLAPATQGGSYDIGVNWRYTLDSNYRVDVTAWRRQAQPDAMALIRSREPEYGARVEMQMGSTTLARGFVAEKGFVGLQLESGAKVTIKRRNGVPMLYYRNTF